MKNIFYLLIILLLIGCSQNPVTFGSLLLEMTDREALTRFPSPEYSCKQFSSYDRETVAPDQPGWFANWDRSMFIGIEENHGRKEYVMMDTEGPGAIVRFWMTFAGEDCGKGTLRIYFDHNPEPVIEGGAMDILSGGKLVGEPLASSVSDSTAYEMRGHNLYLPLPYAQHCKVTYESNNIKDAGAKTGGEAVYYNINYRIYPQGTKVVTFSSDELKYVETTLQNVRSKLAKRDRGLENIRTEPVQLAETIAPQQNSVKEIKGEKAIRKITLKLSASNPEQALRSTLLSIWFDGKDGQTSPDVCCPVGDFFGTGYQIRKSNTWYTEVDENGTMSAYWIMPFARNCKFEILNTGNEDVSVSCEILTSPWKFDKQTMYFGASWNQFTRLHTGEMKNNRGDGGPFDINYVTLKGKGVYVGDAITLFNTVYAWWGEGDEKIYIDGETFPSHIGTGTEDYYGYAWCRPEKFINHPYIAQPDGSGNFRPGYTVNIRYRGLDAIPFNQSLKFDMEMWHWTKAIINFAPVTFYYMLRNDDDPNRNFDMDDVKEPVVLKREQLISPLLKSGENNRYSIEGENLIYLGTTGGSFQYQNNVNHGWSNNMQLFWHGGKTGDRLTLKFISPQKMTGNMNVLFTFAPDYGKFKFSLNDKTVNVPLNAKTLRIEQLNMGLFNILEGENIITVEITGTVDNERKTAFFGLDRIDFIER